MLRLMQRVDCDNMLHGFGQVTKGPYGLKKRFCNFMDNMMMGPYLSTGSILRKYDEVLDEYNIAITRDGVRFEPDFFLVMA